MAAIVGWLWPLEGPTGTYVSPLEEVGWATVLAFVEHAPGLLEQFGLPSRGA